LSETITGQLQNAARHIAELEMQLVEFWQSNAIPRPPLCGAYSIFAAMRSFSGITAVENHTGNIGNLLMLNVISKFSAGIPSAYAADNSPNSS
jgi:hypothetical protein